MSNSRDEWTSAQVHHTIVLAEVVRLLDVTNNDLVLGEPNAHNVVLHVLVLALAQQLLLPEVVNAEKLADTNEHAALQAHKIKGLQRNVSKPDSHKWRQEYP